MNRRKGVLQVHPLVKRFLAFIQCLQHLQRWKLHTCFASRIFIVHHRVHAPWKSNWSQNLVPCFYFSFSISKEKAVINSNFPAGRRKEHFLCMWKNGTPWSPEESSSQEHLCAPTEACPNWVLGIRSLLCKCPTILQYLFPTYLMAMIAWEGSSPGKLLLGLDTAMLTAANVHWNLVSVQLLQNSEMPLLFPFSQPTRLSKAS